MQNFSYNSTVSEAQNIVVERKKKINRHRLVYLILFWAGVASLAWYAFSSIRWVKMDGTIRTNNQQITLMHDAYITDIRVKIGDSIHKGDTLFDFIYTTTARQDSSSFTFKDNSWSEREQHNEMRKIELLESDVEIVNKKIKILDIDIELIKKQIFLGVATESELMARTKESRALKIDKEKINDEIKISKKYLSQIEQRVSVTPEVQFPSEYIIHSLQPKNLNLSKYTFPYVAKYDGMIINVSNTKSTYCYKQNSVMEIQPTNDTLLNLHVEAMVYPEFMEDLKLGDKVEIFVSKNRKHQGEVEFLGYRTAEIPKHLQLPFEKNNTAILVRIKFLDAETIELWEKATGIPVNIRKPRFSF